MKKTHNKTLFVGAITALMALSACESKEEKAARETQIEKVYKEVLAGMHKKHEWDLAGHIYDSLMKVPNTIGGLSADSAYAEYGRFWSNSPYDVNHEIDSLLNARQCDLLDRRVRQEAKPIIERGLQNIKQSLKSYNLYPDINAALEDIDSYGESCDGWSQKYFAGCLLENTSFDDFSETRKREIIELVEAGYRNMMSELKRHRLQIAKDFAVYYPELDFNQVPQKYRSLFNEETGAGKTEIGIGYSYGCLSNSPLSVVREVCVRDSISKPEFYNDQNADYKLVRVGNGKWQVIKKYKKDGKVVGKTPVFSDNGDYRLFGCTYNPEDWKVGDGSFYADTWDGYVCINVNECLWTSKKPKSDTLSQTKETKQRIAELQAKKERADSVQNAFCEYSTRALNTALQMAKARLSKER